MVAAEQIKCRLRFWHCTDTALNRSSDHYSGFGLVPDTGAFGTKRTSDSWQGSQTRSRMTHSRTSSTAVPQWNRAPAGSARFRYATYDRPERFPSDPDFEHGSRLPALSESESGERRSIAWCAQESVVRQRDWMLAVARGKRGPLSRSTRLCPWPPRKNLERAILVQPRYALITQQRAANFA
jgi:hypothetical protein